MADSTANNTPEGFDNAVTAMRHVMSHVGTVGTLHKISLRLDSVEGWLVEAQSSGSLVEREAIDTLRGWALALNGQMTLSEPKVADYGFEQSHWRSLEVTARIAGVAVEIWDHVDRHTTTGAEQEPELVAAHA